MDKEGNRQSGKQWKGKGGEEVDKQIVGQGIGSDTHTSHSLWRDGRDLRDWTIEASPNQLLCQWKMPVLIDFLHYQQVRLRLSEDSFPLWFTSNTSMLNTIAHVCDCILFLMHWLASNCILLLYFTLYLCICLMSDLCETERDRESDSLAACGLWPWLWPASTYLNILLPLKRETSTRWWWWWWWWRWGWWWWWWSLC